MGNNILQYLAYAACIMLVLYMLKIRFYPIGNDGIVKQYVAPADWYNISPPRTELGSSTIGELYDFAHVQDIIPPKELADREVTDEQKVQQTKEVENKKVENKDDNCGFVSTFMEDLYGQSLTTKDMCKKIDAQDNTIREWREQMDNNLSKDIDFRPHQESIVPNKYKTQTIEEWRAENEAEWLKNVQRSQQS